MCPTSSLHLPINFSISLSFTNTQLHYNKSKSMWLEENSATPAVFEREKKGLLTISVSGLCLQKYLKAESQTLWSFGWIFASELSLWGSLISLHCWPLPHIFAVLFVWKTSTEILIYLLPTQTACKQLCLTWLHLYLLSSIDIDTSLLAWGIKQQARKFSNSSQYMLCLMLTTVLYITKEPQYSKI